MTCHICGAELDPVALGGPHAKWLCTHCHRAWWEEELTPAARAAWRHGTHDFGHDLELRNAIRNERLRAFVVSKGTP